MDCAEGNDDFCGEQSQVAWCAFGGVEYHILVHGPVAETDAFAMTVTDDVLFCAEP